MEQATQDMQSLLQQERAATIALNDMLTNRTMECKELRANLILAAQHVQKIEADKKILAEKVKMLEDADAKTPAI